MRWLSACLAARRHSEIFICDGPFTRIWQREIKNLEFNILTFLFNLEIKNLMKQMERFWLRSHIFLLGRSSQGRDLFSRKKK